MWRLVAIVFCFNSVAADLNPRNTFSVGVVGSHLVYRGNVTLPSKVPWHAGIWIPKGPVYEQQCAGTLIAPNLVLTAAHCYWDYKLRKVIPNLHTYKVALGKIYRDWALDTTNPNVQRLDIRRIILDSRFDGYVRRNLENDIALIELATNATLTDFVQPAAVDWTAGPPANGSVGVVAGWGYSETGSLSSELRSIELPYVDHDTCYQSLGADRFKKLLTTDKFCAGFINQAKSVCQGDSGGGYVVVDNVTNIPYVRGIVSIDFRPAGFPTDRCYPLHYTGFTNVGMQRYLTWIREHRPEAPATTCPAVTSSTAVREVFCNKEGDDVDCTQPMLPGSVARSLCAVGYRAGNRTSKTAICRGDGSWSNSEINCQQPVLGYQKFPGLANWYKHHYTERSWQDAKASCEAEGAHLLILNSEEEFTVMKDMIKKNQHKVVGSKCSGCTWVGLKESDSIQNEFYTVLGQPLSATGFSSWHPGEPNNVSLGNGVVIHPRNSGMKDWAVESSIKWACTSASWRCDE